MKNLFVRSGLISFVILLLVFIFPILVSAEKYTDSKGNVYEYMIKNGDVYITGFSGSDDIEIPARIDGFVVTQIGEMAFYKCTDLTGVVIPDGVSLICNDAFVGCTNLTKIAFGENLKTIDAYAFSNCTALKKIEFTKCSVHLYRYAFTQCTNLEEIISLGDISTEESVFKNCIGLKTVTINGKATIGMNAFEDCDNLESVQINGSATLGVSSFEGCDKLESVYVEGVSAIDDCAFRDCISLKNISYGNCSSIGKQAFSGCTKLSEITLPLGLCYYAPLGEPNTLISSIHIGSKAFYNCIGLKKIEWGCRGEIYDHYSADFETTDYIFGNAGTASDGITLVINEGVVEVPANTFTGTNTFLNPNIKTVILPSAWNYSKDKIGGMESIMRVKYTDNGEDVSMQISELYPGAEIIPIMEQSEPLELIVQEGEEGANDKNYSVLVKNHRGKAMLFAAGYSREGRVVSLVCKSAIDDETLSISLDDKNKIEEVKFFVWKAGTVIPLI